MNYPKPLARLWGFNTLLWSLLVLAAPVVSGCDSKTPSMRGGEQIQSPNAALQPLSWPNPMPVDLMARNDFPRAVLQLDDPSLSPPCHEIFEPTKSPAVVWPWTDISRQVRDLYGCQPEGYERLADNRRFISYRLPPNDNDGPDMRFVSYDSDDQLRWHHRMVRTVPTKKFEAAFRRSFIAFPSEKIVCSGTLWDATTQMMCVDDDTGKLLWSGTMDFRAGLAPIGFNNSLYFADNSGITRRYPFNGTEMRHRSFDNVGGRMAYYLPMETQIAFAPYIADAALTVYSLHDLQPQFKLHLPDMPTPNYRHYSRDHELLFIRLDSNIIAINSRSGKAQWAVHTGDDHPVITASPEHIYLLLRHSNAPNKLYQIEPQSGRILWVSDVPLGILHISWDDDHFLMRSVRAVQEIIDVIKLEP